MRIGKVVNRDKENLHLQDTYVQVFPDGTVRDLLVTTAIPPEHKTYCRHVVTQQTQSPLLVRQSYLSKVIGKLPPEMLE